MTNKVQTLRSNVPAAVPPAGGLPGQLAVNFPDNNLWVYDTVNNPQLLNPATVAATQIVAGVAELATQAEVLAGADDLRIVTPLQLQAKVNADFFLTRKESGASGPVWGLDAERSTGADWVLANSGDAIALSVVTGEEMVELGRALAKKTEGQRNPGMAFHQPLKTAAVDPAKHYTIAFAHRAIRAIRTSYGNLPNVEAGPRYTARDILAELMTVEK